MADSKQIASELTVVERPDFRLDHLPTWQAKKWEQARPSWHEHTWQERSDPGST